MNTDIGTYIFVKGQEEPFVLGMSCDQFTKLMYSLSTGDPQGRFLLPGLAGLNDEGDSEVFIAPLYIDKSSIFAWTPVGLDEEEVERVKSAIIDGGVKYPNLSRPE